MYRARLDNYEIDCSCNLLGTNEIHNNSFDDLPHFGYRRASQSDKMQHRTPSFALNRKLSVSQIKRKATPTKQKYSSKKGSDLLKTMTSDQSRKQITNDIINIQIPQRSKNIQHPYQSKVANNIDVDYKTKYGTIEKKYSIQTTQNNVHHLLPLRKVESMINQRKIRNQQTQTNFITHEQINHQPIYLNNNNPKSVLTKNLTLNQNKKVNIETPKTLSSQLLIPSSTSLKNINSKQIYQQPSHLKIASVESNQTLRFPKQSIAQSVFENTQSYLTRKTQTYDYDNQNDKSLSDIGQSIVISRPLFQNPKSIYNQNQFSRLKVHNVFNKQSLQNSRASRKQL